MAATMAWPTRAPIGDRRQPRPQTPSPNGEADWRSLAETCLEGRSNRRQRLVFTPSGARRGVKPAVVCVVRPSARRKLASSGARYDVNFELE